MDVNLLYFPFISQYRILQIEVPFGYRKLKSKRNERLQNWNNNWKLVSFVITERAQDILSLSFIVCSYYFRVGQFQFFAGIQRTMVEYQKQPCLLLMYGFLIWYFIIGIYNVIKSNSMTLNIRFVRYSISS